MKIDYKNKKAIIVDMDGTLYSQKQMHSYMKKALIKYYMFHIFKIKELIGIYCFRKYIENIKYKDKKIQEIEEVVANRLRMKTSKLSEARKYWMDTFPLKYMNDCKYDKLINWLNKSGKKIYVYSDYNPSVKIEKIGLQADMFFYPDYKNIKSLKPDKNAMQYIVDYLNLDVSEILYIGDRFDRDGESAGLLNIDYIDVSEFLAYDL